MMEEEPRARIRQEESPLHQVDPGSPVGVKCRRHQERLAGRQRIAGALCVCCSCPGSREPSKPSTRVKVRGPLTLPLLYRHLRVVDPFARNGPTVGRPDCGRCPKGGSRL